MGKNLWQDINECDQYVPTQSSLIVTKHNALRAYSKHFEDIFQLCALIFALMTSPLWIILIMKLITALKNKSQSGENKAQK